MMYGFGEHGWGMGWGWLIGLLLIAVIVWIVVKLVNTSAGSSGRKHEKSALDILKERYARGEINKEEYEERKRGLME